MSDRTGSRTVGLRLLAAATASLCTIGAGVAFGDSGGISSGDGGSTSSAPGCSGAGSSAGQPDFDVERRKAVPPRDYPNDGIKPELSYRIGGVSVPVDAEVRVIKESSGEVVRRYCPENIPPDTNRVLEWDNRTSSGALAEKGKYKFKIVQPDGSNPDTSGAATNHHFQWRGHLFPVRGSHTYGDGWGAGRGHRGTDVFAACRTTLKAARNGTVMAKQYQGGGAGYYIVIYNSDTNRSYVYMHMRGSTFNNYGIQTGSQVDTRQEIGQVGQSGNASGCHLHFELWVGRWFDGGYAYDSEPAVRKWDTWS